jgi:HEAT repeat protein
MQRDVERLVGSDGRISRDASERLAAAGRRAVALLETGLYDAEPEARRRIVKTLAATRSPEAIPILEHLARHDPDPSVRDAARAALPSP